MHRTWSYVIDVGRDSNGKRIQETKGGFLTKQDARDARRARLAEVRGRSADAHSITVAAYLELWLSRKRALRETTRIHYQRHIDQYLTPRLGGAAAGRAGTNPDHIEDLQRPDGRCQREARSRRRRSAASMRRCGTR